MNDWSELGNGDLLAEAEAAGFDLLITTDQNLRYQQNLTQRRIGIHADIADGLPGVTVSQRVVREIRTSGLTRGSNGIGESRPLLSTLLVHFSLM